jgi:hypothetical protein
MGDFALFCAGLTAAAAAAPAAATSLAPSCSLARFLFVVHFFFLTSDPFFPFETNFSEF